MEQDGDGDPLDHGVVQADLQSEALMLVERHLQGFLEDTSNLPIRLYPALPSYGVWECAAHFTTHRL
jgi:hypothetical protein